MSVLTLRGEEIKAFPPILREFASYKASIENCSEKTVCEYLSDLRTFFRYTEAERLGIDKESPDFLKIDISGIDVAYLRGITTETIYAFLMYTGAERDNHWSAKARKISALKAFYRFACTKRKLLEDNPVKDVDPPRHQSSLPKYMNLEESQLLLRTVKEDTASKTVTRDFAIVTLFLNCGMRLSELVGINLSDIDRSMRSLRVLGKGRKERIIYLNDACRAALGDYITERLQTDPTGVSTEALFLSGRGNRISNKTVQWMVYKYLSMAGLDNRGLSVHKLRHTAATLMYQSGHVDVRVLKDILGHAQLNTTQIYTHVSDENMENAIRQNPLGEYMPETQKSGQSNKKT